MTLDKPKQAVLFLRPSAVHASKTDPRARTASPNWKAAVDKAGNASIALWNPALGSQPAEEQFTAALTDAELADAQKAQSARITAAYRNARYQTPVSITVGSGTTLSFLADQVTQTEVLSYLVAITASNSPAQMPLEDASADIQMLTYAQVQAVAQAITQHSIAARSKHNKLQAQIAAAASIAEVQAIVWPKGN